MMRRMSIITHGGAGASASFKDGTERAAQQGLAAMKDGALAAVLAAVCALEDDPRFNAGTGSNLRLDGETCELDAAVMTSDGRSGAVACLTETRNPILVAAEVRAHTPHLLLAGEGATAFARRRGFSTYDPRTPAQRAKYKEVRDRALKGERLDDTRSWGGRDPRAVWNFVRTPGECLGDTVGAAAYDGHGFAAAVSTGGTMLALRGRVGDVPIIGCGLYAGVHGAVVCTGEGEEIARAFLAKAVYDWLATGASPQAACDLGIALFPAEVGVGLIAVNASAAASACNREMPVGVAR
jgi:L-asparaginase/beta-aspartyl-peptidase (threonine type)